MLVLFFIFLLLLLNGVFAMSEIALISARRTRLQKMADSGDRRARIALELAENPNHFLSTVQIGITLISILAGALGSAAIADQIAMVLARLPFIAPYSETISIGLVVLFITYLTLVIGELVPKRLALLRPEQVASFFAPFMRTLSIITSPAVYLLSRSTDVIIALIGIQRDTSDQVTEEDVKYMIEQGTQVGVFDPIEEELVHEIFRLGDQTLQDLIVPRTEITWLDLDAPISALQQQITTSRHTRFPVAHSNLDNIVGTVLAKDLLIQAIQGQTLDIADVMQQPVYVPASMPALSVLARFQETHSQIALVVGEYGELQGLVTVNDIVEAMFGDLPESAAEADPEIIERADGGWLVDGLLPIHELKALLGQEKLSGDDEMDFRTLGGFVMSYLGQIPKTGDCFDSGAFRFEIVDMDSRRVDKVLIVPRNEDGLAEIAPDPTHLASEDLTS